MAVQFGATAATAARSAAASFNATNVTWGFRFLVPSALSDFQMVAGCGDCFPTFDGFAFYKHSGTNLYTVTSLSGGTEGFPDSGGTGFTVATNVWHSMVIRGTGSGASSYSRWLFNHNTSTLTTALNGTGTRGFAAGRMTLAIRQDLWGSNAGVIRFADAWISHTSVDASICQQFVEGANAQVIVPSLISYWPMDNWVSGNIPDSVGSFPLETAGTPSNQAGPILRKFILTRPA